MKIKKIALVAHDHRKPDLIDWVHTNKLKLRDHDIICTGTTGKLVEEELNKERTNSESVYTVKRLLSGPLGGDQQLGSLIASGEIDMLIFFWDPMSAQPHDVDVKALLRLSVLYNVVTASNRSSADFIISSPLFNEDYTPIRKDYKSYLNRELP